MKKYLFSKKERFSIRKFSVGAASILIGTSLFASASPASADSQGTTASKKNSCGTLLGRKGADS